MSPIMLKSVSPRCYYSCISGLDVCSHFSASATDCQQLIYVTVAASYSPF